MGRDPVGGGVALAGLASSYWVLLALVLVSGLGVAAYHPEGYRTANQVAGARKATGLSLFSIGGNIGIALGPLAVSFLVPRFGLPGTLGLLGPGLLVAALLATILPTLVAAPAHGARAARRPGRRPRHARGDGAAHRGRDGAVVDAAGPRDLRAFLYVDALGQDPRVVGPLLFLFLGAGAVGTLVGGPIADRWGPRRYLVASLVLSTPLIAVFLWRPGGWLAAAALAAAGFVLVSSFSVTVALGQAYLPRHLGMAAGLIVGLAIGTGGLGVTRARLDRRPLGALRRAAPGDGPADRRARRRALPARAARLSVTIEMGRPSAREGGPARPDECGIMRARVGRPRSA